MKLYKGDEVMLMDGIKIIQSKNVWIDEPFQEAQLEIKGNKIIKIHPYGMIRPTDDYGENFILPGFIDIHDHGCLGAYAEVIADGVHVDFNAVRILGKAKGKNHLIAVTDSIWAKGCEPGIYTKPDKGANIIIDEHNVVRLETGSLAGSTNRLNVMVRNLIDEAKLPLEMAINAVTCNPAHLLGIANQYGYIKEKYIADFAIVDKQFNVLETIVDGIVVYSK